MQRGPTPECVAVVGRGEVGEALAVAFVRSGARVIASTRRDAARRRALTLGLVPESKADRAAAAATMICMAVPGEALIAVMQSLIPGLSVDTLVVDLTAAVPEIVEQAAALHPGGGAGYVDGAIMGAISLQGAQVPMVLAGPGAESARDRMASLGLQVRALAGNRIGDAARTKLLCSVLAKGLDALMVETALAAEGPRWRRRLCC